MIKGGAGADELSGSFGGIDTLQGGLGDDLYYVLNATDIAVERADEGFDELQVRPIVTACQTMSKALPCLAASRLVTVTMLTTAC